MYLGAIDQLRVDGIAPQVYKFSNGTHKQAALELGLTLR